MTLLSNISEYPLAFGGAAISGEGAGYGFGSINEDESKILLETAFFRGIKIYDTAPIYGFGLSEKRIGKAFFQNREKVFIISKSGVSWHSTKRVNMTNDPETTLKMLEQSLRDLNSDYIDLYMIHWPDEKVDIRRPMEVLAKAKAQGKIKHIGLCNTHISDLDKAFEIESIEVVQSEFNYFNQSATKDLFPYLHLKNIDFMSWGTLDKGILSGTVDANRKFESSDCRATAPWWKKSIVLEKLEKLSPLHSILEKDKVTKLEFSLMFNLSFEEIKSVLCGMKNIKQLNEICDLIEFHKNKNETKKKINSLLCQL